MIDIQNRLVRNGASIGLKLYSKKKIFKNLLKISAARHNARPKKRPKTPNVNGDKLKNAKIVKN